MEGTETEEAAPAYLILRHPYRLGLLLGDSLEELSRPGVWLGEGECGCEHVTIKALHLQTLLIKLFAALATPRTKKTARQGERCVSQANKINKTINAKEKYTYKETLHKLVGYLHYNK